MVRVYGAGTLPVNGPEAPFILNRAQLWQALERKIRKPSEFVPILSGCQVHSDQNDIVEREVVLNFGKWGIRPMAERVETFGKLWIRFAQSEGSVSTNLVSYGGTDVSETDLLLTYIFEWEWPDIQENSPEHRELTKAMSSMAIMGVQKSIERARELVNEGVISKDLAA